MAFRPLGLSPQFYRSLNMLSKNILHRSFHAGNWAYSLGCCAHRSTIATPPCTVPTKVFQQWLKLRYVLNKGDKISIIWQLHSLYKFVLTFGDIGFQGCDLIVDWFWPQNTNTKVFTRWLWINWNWGVLFVALAFLCDRREHSTRPLNILHDRCARISGSHNDIDELDNFGVLYILAEHFFAFNDNLVSIAMFL